MRYRLLLICLVIPGYLAGDWENGDVPETLLPAGSATEDPAGTWTIEGAGVDIWGVSDEFHFLWWDEPKAGDFAVRCHLVSFGMTPNDWGKAGIMARTGSPLFAGPESYAFACGTMANGACLQWRDGDGLDAAWDGVGVNQWLVPPDDLHLKLIRVGDEFFGYAAKDPPLWIALNSHPFLNLVGAEEMYVGPAVTSHEDGTLSRAVFDEIDLEDPGMSDAGPTALACDVDGGQVDLTWTNGASYDEIALFRQDQDSAFDRIAPGPAPSEDSFTDSPGDGLWTYWISAVEGGRDCVGQRCGPVLVGGDAYAREILADDPIAYWRLGEAEGVTAFNLGSTGGAANGTYTGGVSLGEVSLLAGGEDASVLFNGMDAEVQLPDNGAINTGGPYAARSIEVWFRADLIDVTPGYLFEEGGATRGLSMYVQQSGGEPQLFVAGWNLNDSEGRWGPVWAAASVEEGETYHAVFVFSASENGAFGDFDGRVTLYLDGEEAAGAAGADRLFAHGDDVAIGGVHTNTRLHDNSTMADGGNFLGQIDEVALYAAALDDPDGDGDTADSRIPSHFRAGSGSNEVRFLRGDANADGTVNIADAICVLGYLFGDEENECKVLVAACLDKADANDDGLANIADAIQTLAYLFDAATTELPPPFPACGPDSTGDELGDCTYPQERCP